MNITQGGILGHIRKLYFPILFLIAVGLTGCGVSKTDRVSGGAAIGAATGGVVGALGGPVTFGTGLLIGAAAGAGAGLVTSP
ncbi:MAG TPA: hypothetical protein VE690_00535, partial [Rhodopila sp.]|nr:hypothetical protein [Rhodopila sp.]